MAIAAKLTWDQWAKHRAFCIWCLGAAAATVVMVPLTIPEAARALRETRRRLAAGPGRRTGGVMRRLEAVVPGR